MPYQLSIERLAQIDVKIKAARVNFIEKAFQAWVETTFHKKAGFPKPDTPLLELMYGAQQKLESELPVKKAITLDAECGASPFYKVLRKPGRQTVRQHSSWENVPIGSVELVGYQDTFGTRAELPPSAFDGISMLARFHKLRGLMDTVFISECERLLKPGGIAVIAPFLTWREYTEKCPPEIEPYQPGIARRYDSEHIKTRIFHSLKEGVIEFLSFESGRKRRYLMMVLRKDQ